jgi:uncharacterized OB-fold protein
MSAVPELVHPDLYVARAGGRVNLLGMTCRQCGHVAFPRQRNGCEKCGATDTDLTDEELVCRGTLVSYATVHMHQAKTIAAPFVIGEVKLDRGPTLRATMVETADAALRIGASVVGTLFPAPSSGDAPPRLELRFSLEATS